MKEISINNDFDDKKKLFTKLIINDKFKIINNEEIILLIKIVIC